MPYIPAAVFFDFDGVILESAEIKTEAFLELFKEYKELLPAIKQHHVNNMGVSRYKKFEWIYNHLLNRTITQTELQSLGNQFSALVFQKILQAPVVPGAIPLLKFLQKKCFCFIASGTPELELVEIVKKRRLDHYFTEVCGTPRSKQVIVEELILKYKLNRNHCWFVGDANTDYDAAKATSLNFIGRNTPVMEAYWKNLGSVFIVNSLSEIKENWMLNGS
jgi:phosphoglycolate phosphatase-like HAD superfamily hydrolase